MGSLGAQVHEDEQAGAEDDDSLPQPCDADPEAAEDDSGDDAAEPAEQPLDAGAAAADEDPCKTFSTSQQLQAIVDFANRVLLPLLPRPMSDGSFTMPIPAAGKSLQASIAVMCVYILADCCLFFPAVLVTIRCVLIRAALLRVPLYPAGTHGCEFPCKALL